MSNVIQIRDPQGNAVYPITDASLVIGLQDGPFSEYILSWDGSSAPVVANIPAGVSVIYGSTTYTGTLAASSSTACKVYLVASTSQVGEYDRYITSHTSSVYSWTSLASTQIQSPVVVDNLTTNDPTKALSAKQGKVLNEEVSQLGQKVGDFEVGTGEGQYPPLFEQINGGEAIIETPVQLTLDTFYNTADAIASIGNQGTSVGSASVLLNVTPGEKYNIHGASTSKAQRLYCFADSERDYTFRSENMDTRVLGLDITIPDGTAYMVCNFPNYDDQTDGLVKIEETQTDGLATKVQDHEERIAALEEQEIPIADNLTTDDPDVALSARQGVVLDGRLTDIENEINGTPTTETITYAPQGIGTYINSANTSIGDTFDKDPKSGSTQGYANYKVPVQRGDVVSIYGYGNGNTAKLYVLTNSQNIIVAMVGDKNTHTTPEVLNIEADGWVYVNDLDYSAEVGKVVIQRTVLVDGLEDRMKEYTDEQVESVKKLSGKTILIFGDSMSTAKDASNKTYADYVAAITGAIIKNIAIGGTRFSQRYEPTLTPDTNTAYANLDICNMVYAVCENDFRYADAAVTALDRYSDIIALAKTIVPADIDIIILEGGGNDYLNGRNLGTTDSIDKNTTLGALNYMIQKLSTTFPKAKIIGESNQVLYSNPPAFSATESYVVDDIVIYNPGSGYLRYKFINNHSGAWDFNDVVEINNLEWRKPEFWSDNDERIGGLTFRELIAEFEKRFRFYHIPYANMYETMGWNEYNFSSHYPDTDNHHPNDMKSWSEHLIGYLEKL